ncbi:MAG: hypothetical protein R3D71_06765 [Rickettsiales bacterium]
MRLKTFTAPDIQTAMKMARDTLGDNAIILATDTKSSRSSVTVTAAIEQRDEDSLQSESNFQAINYQENINKDIADNNDAKYNQQIDEIKFELKNILRFHNIPEMFITKMLKRLSDTDIIELIKNKRGSEDIFRISLERLLARNFVFDPLRFTSHDIKIMLIGSSGIGKTLTIAKMATKLAMDNQSLAVITTDTKRAGGIEQLEAFTSILNTELKIAENANELKNIIEKAPPRTRIVIDTAGCSPYDHDEFTELKLFTKIEGIEPVLTLAAGGDCMETVDAVEAFAGLPIRRVLITKTEETKRFGGIISAMVAHGYSFCNVSRSSSLMDSVQPMDSMLLAQILLKYKN